jgi:hypothetical protein
MADKTITITMTGPEEIVLPSLDAFVRQHGWSEGHPLAPVQFARQVLREFILAGVRSFSVSQAQALAGQQAVQAVEAQASQTSIEVAVE